MVRAHLARFARELSERPAAHARVHLWLARYELPHGSRRAALASVAAAFRLDPIGMCPQGFQAPEARRRHAGRADSPTVVPAWRLVPGGARVVAEAVQGRGGRRTSAGWRTGGRGGGSGARRQEPPCRHGGRVAHGWSRRGQRNIPVRQEVAWRKSLGIHTTGGSRTGRGARGAVVRRIRDQRRGPRALRQDDDLLRRLPARERKRSGLYRSAVLSTSGTRGP